MSGEISPPVASMPMSSHQRVNRPVPQPNSRRVFTRVSLDTSCSMTFFCHTSARLYRPSYHCSYVSVCSLLKNHSSRSCQFCWCRGISSKVDFFSSIIFFLFSKFTFLVYFFFLLESCIYIYSNF